VRVAQAEQLLAASDRFIGDGVELLAAVADLGDAKAFALVIEQGGGGFFQCFGRKHRRAGAEVEDAMGHVFTPPATAV
jgi:hypothetical protein